MTARHNFLSWPCPWPQSHKLWKYPLSPPPHSPNPQSHAWAASPFLLLHSKAEAGEGTLWSRAEEGGSPGAACRRTPCLQAVGGGDLQALLPGSQPARGVLEILPTPPTAASCPTWLPARNRVWHSPTRLCVPEIKNRLLTPKLVPGWSVLSRSIQGGKELLFELLPPLTANSILKEGWRKLVRCLPSFSSVAGGSHLQSQNQ